MISDETSGRPAREERVVRLIRPSVVVLCGPAASGKSTFAREHFRSTQIISSDHCRALVCDDEQDQRFNGYAFALLHFIADTRLSLNRLCVIDSTALTSSARKSLLTLARKHRVPCAILLFDVSLETCLAHDQARGQGPKGRAVGRAVLERQYERFEETKSAVAQEGFDPVELLREGEVEKIRVEVIFRPAPRAGPTESGPLPIADLSPPVNQKSGSPNNG